MNSRDLKEHDKQIRTETIDECLRAIGEFSITWEYGQGVKDCYEAIKKLKEKNND